jgi:glycosyltransferase involved in cell wall biosynthesis
VRLVGFRDDITDFLNILDLCVMSSHHEGIPTVLLESMYLRKPVVATAVGGIPEVVEDERSGLLVEPGDPQALAAACLRAVRDRDLTDRLGRAAKDRVESEFSSDILARRMVDLYQSVSGRQG